MLLTMKNLGIPISLHKTEGPVTVIQFFGILLDSNRMEARLPDDKVQEELSKWHNKKSATLRELQSLIGTLNFACRVVPPGRPFLQRIIQLTHKVTKPHHHIKLNAGFREDIRMWQIFSSKWNGCNFLCSQNGKHLKHCTFIQMPQVPWALGGSIETSGFRVNGLRTKWYHVQV